MPYHCLFYSIQFLVAEFCFFLASINLCLIHSYVFFVISFEVLSSSKKDIYVESTDASSIANIVLEKKFVLYQIGYFYVLND